MLDSILEFITQAASSSAFIFCFCNLIIVIILVDLKQGFSIHQEVQIPLSMKTTEKQGTNSKCLVEKDTTGSSPQVSHVQEAEEVAAEAKPIASNNNETTDIDDCSNEEKGNEEEDDELKRRVEEFIEKVNRGWKEELLSKSSLV